MRIRRTALIASKDYVGRRPPHYIYLKYQTVIGYLITIDLINFI